MPVALLLLGHKLRGRSRPAQGAFWGATLGYIVGGALAVTWGMIPPEAWSEAEVARGFAGLWSMLAFPALGAVGGAVVRATHRAKR